MPLPVVSGARNPKLKGRRAARARAQGINKLFVCGENDIYSVVVCIKNMYRGPGAAALIREPGKETKHPPLKLKHSAFGLQ